MGASNWTIRLLGWWLDGTDARAHSHNNRAYRLEQRTNETEMDEGPHFPMAHQPPQTQCDPQEYVDKGLWEVDPLYYDPMGAVNGKSARKRGKAYREKATGDYVCFENADSVVYRVGGECCFYVLYRTRQFPSRANRLVALSIDD